MYVTSQAQARKAESTAYQAKQSQLGLVVSLMKTKPLSHELGRVEVL